MPLLVFLINISNIKILNLFKLKYIFIILGCGIISALITNLFKVEPTDRYIHIRSFRYGKYPYIIRCNRGDRLHLSFSTDDTGHSFFLSEYNTDVKINPGTDEVVVFKADHPEEKPEIKNEILLVASHPGLQKYLISKNQYRCHVWCGLLHGFENGSLIIFPNTLLGFGTGCVSAIFLLLLVPGIYRNKRNEQDSMERVVFHDRWTRFFSSVNTKFILRIIAVVVVYIIIIVSIFGTRVAGRNLGSVTVWIVWLFLLITFLTPFFGKIWCTICPIPFFGDFLQRKSMLPAGGRGTGSFNNLFRGLNLRWPEKLNNSWLMLFSFLLLGTFSTTIVSIPKISGFLILLLIIAATLLALIFELRSFCRYLCPINAFIGHYSRIGKLSLRAKDTNICSGRCKAKFCKHGSNNGWACPYGLNVEEIQDNSKCGLCMECLTSCNYRNTGLAFKQFGTSPANLGLSEAFLGIGLLVIAVVYSIIYHGPWPEPREYIKASCGLHRAPAAASIRTGKM